MSSPIHPDAHKISFKDAVQQAYKISRSKPDVVMESRQITGKTRAIVCFGVPPDQPRPGVFLQVTIDPNMVSPEGDYIRFDHRAEDEIHGWQRLDAITVCEVLNEEKPQTGVDPITMRAVVKE